jgi:methylenetetrahydrofolate reductase (NADPH)
MTEVTPPAFDGHRALHSPRISFEFFPPKTEEMERSLWETINRLAPLTPNFVSVTYGAGGSTRERTHSTIARILKETRLTPAAHLTCVGAPKGEIDDVVARYHEIGVRHIVALRGDPTTGIGTAYHAHPDGYQSSPDLIEGIKKRYPDIEISVSAYPEKHPESPTIDADIDTLKPRSMPARRARSRRCSSITTSTSVTSIASAPAESISRWSPESCRCTISSRRGTS